MSSFHGFSLFVVLPSGTHEAHVRKMSSQSIDIVLPRNIAEDFELDIPLLVHTSLQRGYRATGRVLLKREEKVKGKKKGEHVFWFLMLSLTPGLASQTRSSIDERKSPREAITGNLKPKALLKHCIFENKLMGFEVINVSSHGIGLFSGESYPALFINLVFVAKVFLKEKESYLAIVKIKNVRAVPEKSGYLVGTSFVTPPLELLTALEGYFKEVEKKEVVFEKDWPDDDDPTLSDEEEEAIEEGESQKILSPQGGMTEGDLPKTVPAKENFETQEWPLCEVVPVGHLKEWHTFQRLRWEYFKELHLLPLTSPLESLLRLEDHFGAHILILDDEKKVAGGASYVPSLKLHDQNVLYSYIPQEWKKNSFLFLYQFYALPEAPIERYLKTIMMYGKYLLAQNASLRYGYVILDQDWSQMARMIGDLFVMEIPLQEGFLWIFEASSLPSLGKKEEEKKSQKKTLLGIVQKYLKKDWL